MDVTPSKNSTIVRSRNMVRLTRAALQTAYIVSEELGTSFAERLFTTPRRHRRPDRERAVLASARPLTVEVTLRSPHADGTRCTLAAWRWGRGPVVLLVHGWEGRGSQLGALVEPLVAAGMTVVAFDAPGHGDSPEHRLYLTDLADCIADVAAAVGPLHGIVAHSFGAAGALLAQVRGGLIAPRYVMLAPNVLIDDAVRRFARVVGLDDRDRDALELRLAAHTGVAPAALSLDRLVAARDGSLLIVHDRADREVPFEHGARLAAAWPTSELIATEGLGHRRILRDPQVLARAVEFLRDGVAPARSDLVREVDRWLDQLE
ncbi:MAG: alpha/beta hydrolase [Acidobacteriota bacterium]